MVPCASADLEGAFRDALYGCAWQELVYVVDTGPQVGCEVSVFHIAVLLFM